MWKSALSWLPVILYVGGRLLRVIAKVITYGSPQDIAKEVIQPKKAPRKRFSRKEDG